ncbi:hypothetical protein HN425_02495 [Candidatus Woesearchaeota archaeon]|jgi:hypothetical protein|nr:hypothetical protein [Candidatus Woesearchaeota archaeon]MBT7705921.1 hypothetical protein [archaeon]
MVLNLLIPYIDAFSFLLFLIGFFIAVRVYKDTKSETDIWLLIAIAILFQMIVSFSNVLEWSSITSLLDAAEDYLDIGFSMIWIYISYKFLYMGNSISSSGTTSSKKIKGTKRGEK